MKISAYFGHFSWLRQYLMCHGPHSGETGDGAPSIKNKLLMWWSKMWLKWAAHLVIIHLSIVRISMKETIQLSSYPAIQKNHPRFGSSILKPSSCWGPPPISGNPQGAKTLGFSAPGRLEPLDPPVSRIGMQRYGKFNGLIMVNNGE